MKSLLLEARDINKQFIVGEDTLNVLCDINLKIDEGEFVSIMGTSGSGKSTLLHILSALDRPTSGQVILEGRVLNNCRDSELTDIRRSKMGFIFQFFNLIPVLNVVENITLPLLLSGKSTNKDLEKAYILIHLLGLKGRESHLPSQLSGGQQQRVAIARTLITQPKLIFADEPTGSLDSTTSQQILEIIQHCCVEMGCTIIMVTHDLNVASFAHRVLQMKDGRIVEERHNG